MPFVQVLSALPLATTPDPDPTPSLVDTEITRPCFESGAGQDELCKWVLDRTDSEWLAQSSDWLIVKPVKIIVIMAVALVLRWLVKRAIDRLARRTAEGYVPGILARNRGQGNGRHGNGGQGNGGRAQGGGKLLAERRKQRAETMASVLGSIASITILSLAALVALSEVGLNIGPLIASAGIIGIALGFGAQSLVSDFLSGIFMIVEDQYGVGDFIDAGEASGDVEAVGLRVTRLRDINGTVWYVRNGEIVRVGNMSQGWARAVVDVDVAYGENVDRARQALLRAATEVYADEQWEPMILEEPEVWGVQELSADSVVLRLVVKTVPLKQWKIARVMREHVKAVFDAEDVEIPFPQRTIWLRTQGPGAEVDGENGAGPAGAVADAVRSSRGGNGRAT